MNASRKNNEWLHCQQKIKIIKFSLRKVSQFWAIFSVPFKKFLSIIMSSKLLLMPPLPTSSYLSADLELTFETFRCQWRRRRSQNNLKFTQREAFCVANFTLALTQFKLKCFHCYSSSRDAPVWKCNFSAAASSVLKVPKTSPIRVVFRKI